MSVIITKKEENKPEEQPKARAWTCVFKDVKVRFFAANNESKAFVVVPDLTPDMVKVLESAPCEIKIVEGAALFNASRFCEFAIFDDEVRNLSEWNGPLKCETTVNLKLRHSEFDYKAGKGYRAGHASRLEVIGMRVVGEIKPMTGNMEGI